MLKLLDFLFVLIFVFILFYIINKYLLIYKESKENKEHYLTYFLPFYDNKISALTNFYANNEDNNNSFKHKFNYKKVIFSGIDVDIDFIKKFINEFLANSFNYEISYTIYDNLERSINDLIENKINFCLNTMSVVNHYSSVMNKNISSLRLVSNLYKLYIYIFTLKESNIHSIKEIPSNTVIGIIDRPDSFYFYCEKFMTDLGYKIGEDYKVIVFKKKEELFDALIKKECNLIIINDIFPNKDLTKILDDSIGEFVILLPFDIFNEKLFLKKNNFLFTDNIDLNLLSRTYLPKTFGNYNYNMFKPDFKICYMYKILMSNSTTDDQLTYSFSKFIFENYKRINKNITEFGYKLNVYPTKNRLEYHAGSLKYMKEFGYTTNIDNPNCAFLIGVMECNEENLKKNNLLDY
jgi:hypothetical protein